MLDFIARHHPADIHQPLGALKEATWRLMHSYVHGGIRPVVQSFVAFPHHEAGSLLINANGVLLLATNAVRMAHALPSPMLATLQQQFARSEEHTSELQSLMRISYAVFCLKKKNNTQAKISYEYTRIIS